METANTVIQITDTLLYFSLSYPIYILRQSAYVLAGSSPCSQLDVGVCKSEIVGSFRISTGAGAIER